MEEKRVSTSLLLLPGGKGAGYVVKKNNQPDYNRPRCSPGCGCSADLQKCILGSENLERS